MPNLRNFWIRTDVDNKMHPVATGPRKKDGGMYVTLSIRNKGRSEVALRIQCIAHENDMLEIRACNIKGDPVYTYATER